MRGHLHRFRSVALTGSLAGATLLAAGCGISQQQEIEIGRQYAAEVNRELPIIDDAAANRYVNLLGDRIARQGHRNLDYKFYVVNTDAVNAFALPGGFIYVNRGLIERTDNLAEFAGVLAHEIGHVEERHSVEQLERMQRANLGLSLGYILLGRSPGGLERAGVQVAGAAIFAGFSRAAESEADAVAVRLLPPAGIDPTGLLTFFKKLLADQESRPSAVEQWFSTHPVTEERIASTRALIHKLPPEATRNLIVDTDQYDAFKARIARYPQPPPRFRQQH